MININIYLRKHNKISTSGNVWISFYIRRQKVNFSTLVSVEEKNWNKKKLRVGSGDKNAHDKNLIIENVLSRTGQRKPTKSTIEKIEKSLHALAHEIRQVRFTK